MLVEENVGAGVWGTVNNLHWQQGECWGTWVWESSPQVRVVMSDSETWVDCQGEQEIDYVVLTWGEWWSGKKLEKERFRKTEKKNDRLSILDADCPCK